MRLTKFGRMYAQSVPASELVCSKGAIANVANEVLRQLGGFDSFVQSALVIIEHVGEGEGGAAKANIRGR